MKFHVWLLISVLAFSAILNCQAVAEIRYTVTDLGVLGDGERSYACGINASGQVVGYSAIMPGSGDEIPYHAFLYSDGVMQDIGTLGGTYSEAYGINDNGQVVGVSKGYSSVYRAFLYSGGVMQDIGTLGGRYSIAYGINAGGQVVGEASYTTWTGTEHPFLYSGGVMQDISSNPLDQFPAGPAYGINDSGQVVGISGIHAFLYSGGVMQDIGTLGGTYSIAYGINANGQVVGSSRIAGDSEIHAFLYSGGVMQDIGTLGGTESYARGINASGQVVGGSYITENSRDSHAFLYSNGIMTDLNTLLPADSGWILKSANAINDSGQIVGYGLNPEGDNHAFLLTPIPEPATLFLLALGSLATRRRCHR